MPAKINDGLTNDQRFRLNSADKVKRAHDKYMNKPGMEEKRVQWGKAWRATDKGIFTRNRNHWVAAGIKEPNEGWETYWETFKNKKNCETCGVTFSTDKKWTSNQKCLDHHHSSGHIRLVVCRKCNGSCVKTWDSKMNYVLLDLHRYFRLNDV